ncbi:MAG: hypothetical protein HY510_01795 [Acidobacteria bacterium]|nr:hypothetical protein [Acidobacteriota bacterium]
MIFAFHDPGLKEPFLCVDGVVEGGLNVSHWPGNRTPKHLKADTTTEMVLKLARDPGRDDWLRGIPIVTNNHFDTDGLLSVYGALRPEEALRHERALVQAARTGDFEEFTTPEAFKLDAVVTAFDDDGRSPVASEIRGRPQYERYEILYDRLLDMMPDLISGAARYKELWADAFASLIRSLMRIGDVARVREHAAARLTVIEASEPLDRMARFNVARHHRVLTATRMDGGCIYEMAFRIFSWFDTLTPPRGGRFDLQEVAAEFNAQETAGGGRWTYTGSDSLDARLYRAGPEGEPVPSSLPLPDVEEHLTRICAARS